MPDFRIADEGTLVLFTPITQDAQDHARIWFADAVCFGFAYCVEHRFALPIIEDLIDHGFQLEAM